VSDEEPTGSCILCHRLEPKSPPACDPCRNRLAARLWELRDLHALLPAALAPGRGEVVRISGSREAPLPLRVAAVDYAAPARSDSVRDQLVARVRTWFDPDTVDRDGFWFHGWHRELLRDEDGVPLTAAAHDQDGALSVASILDSWVRDWAETLDVQRPVAGVPALVSWLSRHLHWALNNHPAVDEFNQEVTVTLYAVRTLLNVSRKPVYLPDACPQCDVTALRRDPGGGDVVCGNCREHWPYVPSEHAA
jgi:hypothetical protein